MKITRQLRKNMISQAGFAPLQVTINWQGNRLRVSTGMVCKPEYWDEEESVVLAKRGSNYNHINPKLNLIAETAQDLLFKADKEHRLLSKEELDKAIKEVLSPPAAPALPAPAAEAPEAPANEKSLFFQLMTEWIKGYDRKIHRSTFRKISNTTIAGLNATMSRFEQFAEAKGIELTLEGMNNDFYHDFWIYITETLDQEVNTFGKHINRLRTFLAWCEDEKDLAVNRRYRKFVAPSVYVGVDALTEQELRKIYNLDFGSSAVQEQLLAIHRKTHDAKVSLAKLRYPAWVAHVELARDKFLALAYTGLRISDCEELSWNHVKGQMIHIKAGKNQHDCYIPFYDDDIFRPVELATKYETVAPGGLMLPRCYRVNDFLKVVQELAGITRLSLSTKLGRKTFVTLKLYQGVPTRMVMQSTGHTTEKSFNHYVGVDTLKLLQEFVRRSPGMRRTVA